MPNPKNRIRYLPTQSPKKNHLTIAKVNYPDMEGDNKSEKTSTNQQ